MYISMMFYFLIFLFFFKQKTAYEMRISDWSSDVCSSDLIAALLQELRHVNAVALTAGKLADLLLLIATLEIEGPHIGAGLEFMLADGHEIMAAGNFLPDIMVGIQMIAALIDIAELHRIADFDGAAIGRFLAGDKLEQRSEEHTSALPSLRSLSYDG